MSTVLKYFKIVQYDLLEMFYLKRSYTLFPISAIFFLLSILYLTIFFANLSLATHYCTALYTVTDAEARQRREEVLTWTLLEAH